MIFGVVHHSTKRIALFEEHKDKWAIVAGMNLPMLIEAYGARLSMESAHEIAAYILETAKEGVKVKPEELEPADTGKSHAASAEQSNAGAPGSFEYVLARIDSRLLHGQVATAWTKTVQSYTNYCRVRCSSQR